MKNKDLATKMAANKLRTVWYAVLLCVTSALNVGFLFLAVELWEHYIQSEYVYLIMSAFSILTSGILVFFVWLIYRHFIIKPLDKVRESARRVATGNFTVRLPIPKKGKKDEFYVLFNDFNKMVEELSSTEILKSDFISNVSHEFKTPLAVIQNYSTMLQSDGLSNEERKNYALKICNATKNLSNLVTDILSLSRLENQKIVVNKQKYNLSEQLYRCSLCFEQEWEKKNIDISIECDDKIEIYSDENLYDIVWNNLLSNAFKFTEENGKVSVKAEAADGTVTVKIADSGCGMSEQAKRHIFEKFYQEDTSHKTKGNGLGLALVKEIINLTDAEISVESSPNEGSVFSVKIAESR